MCVVVRDLIVYGVLTDMMKGRPAVYATFSSYDEVAHHSGLERADTLEALRKLDQQFGRIERARRYAPRPYEIVVLSDHGQTQGATFKQRNGYGLDELVRRSLEAADVTSLTSGDENDRDRRHAFGEATGRDVKEEKRAKNDVSGGGRRRARLGQPRSRLPDGRAAPTDAARRSSERHPRLLPALREHPHVGWLLVRSSERGPGRARRERQPLPVGGPGRGRGSARALLAERAAPPAPHRRLRSTSPTSWSAASTTPTLDEGCAFEELISFHGGHRRPADAAVHPPSRRSCALPDEPIVGAASVHALLRGWRTELEDSRPDSATEAVSG